MLSINKREGDSDLAKESEDPITDIGFSCQTKFVCVLFWHFSQKVPARGRKKIFMSKISLKFMLLTALVFTLLTTYFQLVGWRYTPFVLTNQHHCYMTKVMPIVITPFSKIILIRHLSLISAIKSVNKTSLTRMN